VTDPDDRLVQRYLEGDASAFTALVERHETRVYNVCLRILGDREDARDASQETFITVLRKLPQFRGESAFSTWLHRVAVNACYDALRKRKRHPLLRLASDEDRDALPEPGPAAPDPAEAVAGEIDVVRALAQVPEDYRIALILADVQDLPYEEISRTLDVPLGTVKSRVHRGRVALARAMGISPGGEAKGEHGTREPDQGLGSSEEKR
jgi:RNA polymerase sigma-70 factor, ECF subfamily